MIALLVASVVVWIALEAVVSTREPHAHLPREIATGLALLAVHATAIADRHDSTAFAVIGGVLIAAGIALRITAIRALGNDFVSTTSQPVRVVKRGPYRLLKHPSEVGLLAAAAGAAALLASPLAACVVAIVLAPLVIMRCTSENRTVWAR